MHYVVVPFKSWHMPLLLDEQPVEASKFPYELNQDMCRQLEEQNSWTMFNQYGLIIAAGGTIEQWPKRHIGWVYTTVHSSGCMLQLTRAVQKYLKNVEGRIEMTVRKDFKAGHRWAEMLGFEVETPVLKNFGPEGADHVGYVRIQ